MNPDKIYTFGEPAVYKQCRSIQYVITSTGCFNCCSHKYDRDGYPKLERGHKWWPMGRYIYTITYGEIPLGLVTRHTCDNPHCINPAHLILGTRLDNRKDQEERNRQATGDRIRDARLTVDQVISLRLDEETNISQLSKKYGLRYSVVWKVKRWKTHRNILAHLNPNNPNYTLAQAA